MPVDYGQSINNTLGKTLPIPYIEQVQVFDEYLNVRVALYFNVDVDVDIDEYFSDLQSYVKYVYLYQIIDGNIPEDGDFTNWSAYPYSGSVEDGRTIAASNILSNKYSVIEFHEDWAQSFTHPTTSEESLLYYDSNNINIISLASFERKELPTEVNGQFVYKFVAEEEIAFYDGSGTARNNIPFSLFKSYGLDLNLFCFTLPKSTVSVNSDSWQDTFWKEYEDGHDKGYKSYTREFLLGKALMSDTTHQGVFQTGSLSITPTEIYSTAEGKIYNDGIIQAIDGTYHAWPPQRQEGMLQSFSNLLISSSDEAIRDGVNSLSYILAEYGEAIDLMPRLYSYYKVFPDKTTATKVGSWFEGVSKFLFTTNKKIKRTTTLKKEIVATPVVLDLRTTNRESYEVPDASTLNKETDYIYVGDSMLMYRNGYYGEAQQQGTTQEFSTDASFDTFNHGFYFFDFEKALRTQSQISQVLNVEKLDDLFGKEITSQKFKLVSSELYRYEWSDFAEPGDFSAGNELSMEDTALLISHVTQFNVESESTHPEVSEMYFNSAQDREDVYFDYSFADFTAGTTTSQTYLPYLMPRSFDLAGSSGLGDYRLMCFEFFHVLQNVGGYASTARNDDVLTFQIACKDYTKDIFNTIVSKYEEFLAGSFTDYVEAANEFCSFNNIDNHFNEFFADSITAEFTGDPSTAPWFVGPVTYNLHLDLVTNQWGGDRERIIAESKAISERISPEGGTLDELNAFYETMQGFYDSLYAPDVGALAIVADGLSDAIDLTFGGLSKNHYPLPAVDFLNLTPTAEQVMDTNVWIRISMWGDVSHTGDLSADANGRVNIKESTTQPWGTASEAGISKVENALLFYAKIIAETTFTSDSGDGSSYKPTAGYLADGGLVGGSILSGDGSGYGAATGTARWWDDYYYFVNNDILPEIPSAVDGYFTFPDLGEYNYQWTGTLGNALSMFARIAWPNDANQTAFTKNTEWWGYNASEHSIDTMKLLSDNGFLS